MEGHGRREQRKLSTQDVNDQVADTRWPMTDLRGPSTAQFRACSFRTSVIGYSASGYRRPVFTFYQPRTSANINGATMLASLSITNFGVSIASFPQVIFSFGTAPEYDP